MATCHGISRLRAFLFSPWKLCFSFLYVVTSFTLLGFSKGSPGACGHYIEPMRPFCCLLFILFYIFNFILHVLIEV